MPGARIQLSKMSPKEFTQLSQPWSRGSDFKLPTEREEPDGFWPELAPGGEYHCFVVEALTLSAEAAAEAEAARQAQIGKLREAFEAEEALRAETGVGVGVSGGGGGEDDDDLDSKYAEFGGLQDTWGGDAVPDDGEAPKDLAAAMGAAPAGASADGPVGAGDA